MVLDRRSEDTCNIPRVVVAADVVVVDDDVVGVAVFVVVEDNPIITNNYRYECVTFC